MADMIRIKKKDVRRILSLYTLEGLTQKEIGQIVLGGGEIKGVSTYTVVQRVLHYFGLNMEHRRDYKHEGLTDDIIDLILENRTLAFPLAIPADHVPNAAVNFNVELNKYLGGSKLKWNVIGTLKNLSVVAVLWVLTYFTVISPDTDIVPAIVGIVILFGSMTLQIIREGFDGRGFENTGKKAILDQLSLYLFIAFISFIVFLFYKTQ